MLAVSKYPKEYIDAARARIDADFAAYKKLGSPPKAFEHAFFNNMLLALDRYFVHRVRMNEGKDGNPLNEVRVLVDSLMDNGGVMTANKTIKMRPEGTVLGCELGDEIKVDADGFRRLADGFFAELEGRYT